MHRILTFAVILTVSTACMGGYVYDAGTQTLSVTDPADLVSTIDPVGLAEIEREDGMTKADFLALNPQVIDFGAPAAGSAGVGQPTSLVVQYDAAKSVTFNFNTEVGYNYGGYYSRDRSAFSGTEAWHNMSSVETRSGDLNSWFDTTFSTSDLTEGIGAIGFCVSARTDVWTSAGQAIFTLSDGSVETVDIDDFGGGDPTPQNIFVGYQAPTGKTIAEIVCSRPGGGSSFVGIDDIGIVMVPEPASMTIVGLGLLGLLRKRRSA